MNPKEAYLAKLAEDARKAAAIEAEASKPKAKPKAKPKDK